MDCTKDHFKKLEGDGIKIDDLGEGQFGEVVLEPEQVNVSSDASAVTEVRFPSPVYLSFAACYMIFNKYSGNIVLSISKKYLRFGL